MNKLKYALITVNVSQQHESLDESIAFLEEAKERLKDHKDGEFICRIAQAEAKLSLGLHHDCIDILNAVSSELEPLADVDTKVYANMHCAFSNYYRRKEDYENFYKSALQFLAYTPSTDLTNEQSKQWSIKIGMAVLLGKNIFNISELLDKEILNSLKGSDFEWLYHML